VKRAFFTNRNSGVLLRMCVPRSGTQVQVEGRRSSGSVRTGIIVTADVDVPGKVLEKRIHLAEVASEEEKQGISVAFWASRART
jgi:hypothetical protein